jgi:hypothetical protein
LKDQCRQVQIRVQAQRARRSGVDQLDPASLLTCFRRVVDA